MALGRIVIAAAVVLAWLVLWAEVERRRRASEVPAPPLDARRVASLAGEALVLTLFGALWFGSLGAGAWWLVFVLVGALREWPVRNAASAVRILRIVTAGGLLAWRLGP
jgi:hypothetical protein